MLFDTFYMLYEFEIIVRVIEVNNLKEFYRLSK